MKIMNIIISLLSFNYLYCSNPFANTSEQPASSTSVATSVQAIDSSALKTAQEYAQKYAQAAYGFHISPQDICKATIAAAHVAQASIPLEYAPSSEASNIKKNIPTKPKRKRQRVPCTWPGCTKKVITLNRHLKIHTNTKAFQCSYCKLTGVEQRNINIHFATHIKENKISCDTCATFHVKRVRDIPKELLKHIHEKHIINLNKTA